MFDNYFPSKLSLKGDNKIPIKIWIIALRDAMESRGLILMHNVAPNKGFTKIEIVGSRFREGVVACVAKGSKRHGSNPLVS